MSAAKSARSVLADRRIWGGERGLELRISAVRDAKGRLFVEIEYVYAFGPAPLPKYRLSAAAAARLGTVAERVLTVAARFIDADALDSDLEEQSLCVEAATLDCGATAIVHALAGDGIPILTIRGNGTGDASLLIELPWLQALELPDALEDMARGHVIATESVH
jgi:hypothetical protein